MSALWIIFIYYPDILQLGSLPSNILESRNKSHLSFKLNKLLT